MSIIYSYFEGGNAQIKLKNGIVYINNVGKMLPEYRKYSPGRPRG